MNIRTCLLILFVLLLLINPTNAQFPTILYNPQQTGETPYNPTFNFSDVINISLPYHYGTTSVLTDDNYIFRPENYGGTQKMYAYNKNNYSIKWEFIATNYIDEGFGLGDELYVSQQYDTISKINKETGSFIWNYTNASATFGRNPIIYYNNSVFVVGRISGTSTKIYRISSGGSLLNTYIMGLPMGIDADFIRPSIENNVIYTHYEDANSHIRAYYLNGDVKWTTSSVDYADRNNNQQNILITDNHIVVSGYTSGYKLFWFNKNDGTLDFTSSIPVEIYLNLLLINDTIITSNSSNIFGFNATTGIYKFDYSETVSTLYEGGLAASTSNGLLYYTNGTGKTLKTINDVGDRTDIYIETNPHIQYLTSTVIDDNGLYVIAKGGSAGSPESYIKIFQTIISPTYDPSGYVNDFSGNPLQDVLVTFWNSSLSTAAITNPSGYYNLSYDIADGFYDFTFEKDGYADVQGTGTFTSGGSELTNITMYNVNINGIVYDASNGTIISDAGVDFIQTNYYSNGSSRAFSTTSDANGAYSFQGFLIDKPIEIFASKSGYNQIKNFSVTPVYAGNYTMDLYMLSTAPCPNKVCGIAVEYPWYQSLGGVNVTVSNSTYSNSTISNTTTGYFEIPIISNGAYDITGVLSRYTTNESTVTVAGNTAVSYVVMQPIYNLTIQARNSLTTNFIQTFQSYISGNGTSTTDGDIVHEVGYGIHYVSAQSTGYVTLSKNVFVSQDKTEIYNLAPIGDYYPNYVYTKFVVKGLFDNPYAGVTITVYEGVYTITSTVFASGITDSMGQAVFQLTKNQYYTIVLTDGGLSETLTFYVYGKDDEYPIRIIAGFPSGGNRQSDINATLTWSTFNATYNNLSVIYNDTTASTTALNFYATNITTSMTCTETSNSNVVTLNCTVMATGTYQFGYNATSTIYGFFKQDKVIDFDSGISSDPSVPHRTDATTMHWAAIILIVLVASMFSIRNVKHGAVAIPFLALILWAFGWFQAPILLITIAVVIGIMIYMRQSEIKIEV